MTPAMKSTIIICSVFIGTLIATPSIAQRGKGPVLNKEYMEWKMRKDLGLNDDQIAKVTEMREKHQTELKSILTPEQYEKWQDIRFENFENRAQDRRIRQGNRPMRGQMQMRGDGPSRPGNMRGYPFAPKSSPRRG